MPDAISVIMPVYNGLHTLERAVRSVQRQSWVDWELLAIDDCSTDGSGRLLEQWSSLDSRIRVLCTAVNSGEGAARNVGLQQARGEFIAYLDCDDEFHANYLEGK